MFVFIEGIHGVGEKKVYIKFKKQQQPILPNLSSD